VLRDPKLRALQAAIGPGAFSARLEVAKAREATVKTVLASAPPRIEAARALAGDVAPRTVMEWVRRWSRSGLEGLVDRVGVVSDKRALEAPLETRRAGEAPSRRRVRPTSFLKWAGGKAAILDDLEAHVPGTFGRYYEPMVGSGTLFLRLAPESAVLCDANDELMNCYRVIRDDLPRLLTALRRHENSYDHFIRVRAQDPAALPPIERTARMIFLNKTCFNGLYRVNRQGRFNVPYGRIPSATWVDEEILEEVRAKLGRAVVLRSGDVEEAVADAKAGDFVYLDPPYVPAGQARAFTHYGAASFGLEEHRRIARLFRALNDRGVHVLLSNSDTPLVRELYSGFRFTSVSVQRRIDARAGRRTWAEVLVSTAGARRAIDPSLAAEVLFGYGPLPLAEAARIVARELGEDVPSAKAAIEAAEHASLIDRPSRSRVRSVRSSRGDYGPLDWALCVNVTAPAEPIARWALADRAAAWARANMGLIARDDEVRHALTDTIERLVRAGILVRTGRGRVRTRRAPGSAVLAGRRTRRAR